MTSKLQRHELVSQGLCIKCRQKSDKIICLECKKRGVERTAKIREDRELKGLCRYCGGVSLPYKACLSCREKRKKNRIESVG
jgi:hypothetical protein